MSYKKIDLKTKVIFVLAIILIAVVVLISLKTNVKKNNNTSVTTILESDSQAQVSNSYKFAKMSETDIKFDQSKINIYVFWGDGCPHCEELANYLLADIPAEYANYFNVYSFEVWNDTDNRTLMSKFETAINFKASGVPFMVIGTKHISGYSESMNEQILSIIKEQYDKKNNNNNYVDAYKVITGK